MNLWTILRYLFGRARTIREVSQSSASIPLGIVLVLFTAVARNYDQSFVTESPLWLFGPLLFSSVSGAWLFFIVYDRCIKRHLAGKSPPAYSQWRSFMGLFWMTAPIAWLYAIPVERFLDPIGAAKANITLLGIVSAWRVLLMGRVISIVNAVPLLRALAWVLVGAAFEVIIVVFFGGLFGGSFSKRILAGMSGMRNAPDEMLLLKALGFSWNGAWVVLIVTLLALALFRYRDNAVAFSPLKKERFPWVSVIILMVVWLAIAWPAQHEQQCFRQHAKMISNEQYVLALAFLSAHRKGDFPTSRRLEPNPYEYRVWEQLPPTVALLTTNTPPWVRETYLNHLAATFQHHFSRYRSLTNVATMYSAIAKLPESRDWLRTNETALARQGIRIRDLEADEQAALTNILSSLRFMGMSVTNLAAIAK